MTSVTLNVSVSLCAHSVMKGVTFGTLETLVMLLVHYSYLTMVPQCFLLHLWLFGVSNILCVM